MEADSIPRWLMYVFVVVLVVGVAGAGFLYLTSLTEERETTAHGYSVTEDTEEGVVVIEVDEVTRVTETTVDTGIPLIGEVVAEREDVRYDRLNVSTDEGGGTGEFLDGYEPGDTVRLEATEEPEWKEEGDGGYAADGDQVLLITPHSDTGRYLIAVSNRTEPVNHSRSEWRQTVDKNK